ncbi:MAG: DUF4974 domain-containing protein [Bacteroidales bacterium]|nr:DUF4974 domain-containing protein [Bacteroidales bacterium]
MGKQDYMDQYSRIKKVAGLIFKSIIGRSSNDELGELRKWRDKQAENEQLYQKFLDKEYIKAEYERLRIIDHSNAMNNMKARIAAHNRKNVKQYIRKISAVAAILITLVSGLVMLDGTIYNFFGSGRKLTEQQIKHGQVKALLTLGNGKSIQLDDAEATIKEEELLISKAENGSLSYEGVKPTEQGKIKFNDLVIPRGGEFSLILEDGTKVWLNADSKLRYPIAFTGEERKVFLEGEAYFKVSKGSKPFVVDVQGQLVQVYGTEFNISGYPSDPKVYTTLVEGKVSVKAIYDNNVVELEPGFQSIFNKNNLEIELREVNTDEVASWKTGMIVFENQSLEQIMQNLARWYNFDYKYTGNDISHLQYRGKVPRYGDFKEVLKVLEECGGIKLSVKGKMVTITGL